MNVWPKFRCGGFLQWFYRDFVTDDFIKKRKRDIKEKTGKKNAVYPACFLLCQATWYAQSSNRQWHRSHLRSVLGLLGRWCQCQTHLRSRGVLTFVSTITRTAVLLDQSQIVFLKLCCACAWAICQAERQVNYEFTAAYLAQFVGDLPLQKEVEAWNKTC